MTKAKPEATPFDARFNAKRGTSTLYFRVPELDGVPETISTQEYDMRGSIVFPTAKSDNGSMKIEGYALLAGFNVTTRVIRVFEIQSYKSITPLYDRQSGIPTDRGMVWWFHQAWTKYYASRFYWQDAGLTSRQYKLEVYRNPAIKPSPALIEIKWANLGAIEQVMWRRAAESTLRFPQALKNDIVAGGDESVAKEALLLVLAGFEKSPWRFEE